MLTLTVSNSPHCLNSQYPKRHQDAPCPSVPYWATHCAPKTSDTISSTIVRVKGGFIVPTIALVVISITHTHTHVAHFASFLILTLALCHEGERVRGCFFVFFLIPFFQLRQTSWRPDVRVESKDSRGGGFHPPACSAVAVQEGKIEPSPSGCRNQWKWSWKNSSEKCHRRMHLAPP